MEGQNRNPGMIAFVICIIVSFMLGSFSSAAVYGSRLKEIDQNTSQTYAADTLYDKLSNSVLDSGKYKTKIISCEDEVFTLRKITSDSRYDSYRIVTETKTGEYKIVNVNELNCNIYVLTDSSIEPYAIMTFSASNKDTPLSIDIYLPNQYKIVVISSTDTIIDNFEVKGQEITE